MHFSISVTIFQAHLNFPTSARIFQPRWNFPTSPKLSNFGRNFPTSLSSFQLRWALSNVLVFPTVFANYTYPLGYFWISTIFGSPPFLDLIIFLFPIYIRFQTKVMFPMYRLCFQSNSYVSNIQIMFPISYVCFQYTVYVSKRKWCFQTTMFPMYVSNIHGAVNKYQIAFCCIWV